MKLKALFSNYIKIIKMLNLIIVGCLLTIVYLFVICPYSLLYKKHDKGFVERNYSYSKDKMKYMW